MAVNFTTWAIYILRASLMLTVVLLMWLTAPIVNPFNPMAIQFVTNVTLKNESSESIYITPIATWDGSRDRGLLARYKSKIPAFKDSQNRDILIAPNEAKTVFYDGDDDCLSEIVVRNSKGEL